MPAAATKKPHLPPGRLQKAWVWAQPVQSVPGSLAPASPRPHASGRGRPALLPRRRPSPGAPRARRSPAPSALHSQRALDAPRVGLAQHLGQSLGTQHACGSRAPTSRQPPSHLPRASAGTSPRSRPLRNAARPGGPGGAPRWRRNTAPPRGAPGVVVPCGSAAHPGNCSSPFPGDHAVEGGKERERKGQWPRWKDV